MDRYKGYLDGEGGEGECVISTNPRGGWYFDDVTPSNLPEGSYDLTFERKRGVAHLRGGVWSVEDVQDA